MFGLEVTAALAMLAQPMSPGDSAVLIRAGGEPLIVTVDLAASPEAGCRFLEALITAGEGGRIEPLGGGVGRIIVDGAPIGVFADGEPTASGEQTGRFLDQTDPAVIGADPVEDGAAFDRVSLMGPTPAQCGW